jgi:hypothetical protein
MFAGKNVKSVNMIFELLEADTANELELKVNQKLAAGWQLYGNLVTAIKPDTSEIRGGIGFAVESKIILFQAVIKNESGNQ